MAFATGAPGENVLRYSSDFTYASVADAHLGGDDFSITSVRVDHGTGRAETARVTASGRLLSLEYFGVAAPARPGLPQPDAAELNAGSGGPLVEGSGPVGVAAEGRPGGTIRVRTIKPREVASMADVPSWARFEAALRGQAADSLRDGQRGTYLRLSAREANLSWPEAPRITRAEIGADPMLANLFGAPFALIPVGDAARLADLNPVLRLGPGESRQFAVGGRLFVVARFDLN